MERSSDFLVQPNYVRISQGIRPLGQIYTKILNFYDFGGIKHAHIHQYGEI